MDTGYCKKYEPIFGYWHIEREIGAGSYGHVFELSREDFGHTYRSALKVITIPQNKSEVDMVRDSGMDEASVTAYFLGVVEQFVEEFTIMERLKGNSNIVSYEDHRVYEHEDGIGWDILIRMELLTPLAEYMRKNGTSRRSIIRLGIDMCKALELCQRRNIIHRDIKPENIFVSEDGNFKLGDFGIARTAEKTSGGLSKKGTYTYMAPEVYKGEPYGPSVDIYSLGIVLYRLLNDNRAPFQPAFPAAITHADAERALEKRISGAPLPPPANADGHLAQIVLKACAAGPKDRYSSPVLMRQELESIEKAEEKVEEQREIKGKYCQMCGSRLRGDALFCERCGSAVYAAVNNATAKPPAFPPRDPTCAGGRTVSGYGDGTTSGYDASTVSPFSEKWTPVKPPARKKKRKLWLIATAIIAVFVCVCIATWLTGSKGEDQPAAASEQTAAAGQTVKKKMLRCTYYDSDGTIEYLEEYEYDSDGNMINSTFSNSDGTRGNRNEYEYDADGKRLKFTNYALDGTIYIWYEYEYDADGNRIKQTCYDSDGTIIFWYEYECDAEGNEIKESYYDSDGSIMGWGKCEYDSGGNKIKTIYYDQEGTIWLWDEYEYDADGNMTKRTSYNADGSIDSWIECTWG